MTTMRIRAKKFLKTIAEKILPILTILFLLTVVWYFFTIYLNSAMQIDKYDKQGISWNISKLVLDTMSQERPKLPAPHQIAEEIRKTTVEKKITSKRSLIYHSSITLSSTIVGFILGTVLGVVLAVSIVENRAMESSLMPWIIASQTIPILAIAPMIIVVLNSLGFSGLLPKALISTYLSFFPIVVGMVKGLRSPDIILVDLMKTYNSTKVDIFFKLRLPASVPFLFTSMKVAIAISLVGAIVGELPTGAVAGLGARLLTGSYYGQTIQIWSALIMASILAATLVFSIQAIGYLVSKKMGYTNEEA